MCKLLNHGLQGNLSVCVSVIHELTQDSCHLTWDLGIDKICLV